MKYALVGNPNCGKTTIFNSLTGLNQKVGNWSGVTVDKKTGFFDVNDKKIEIVDIPGIYSLSVSDESSIDEQIAYSFIINEKPDAVINVLDASNLARGLYLTMQLLELGLPVILAVNMVDAANAKGIVVHYDKLQKLFGCKVLPIIGSKGVGIGELKNTLAEEHSISSYDFSNKYPISILSLQKTISSKIGSEIASLWLATEIYDGKSTQLAKSVSADELNTIKEKVSNDSINVSVLRHGCVRDIIKECTEKKAVKKVNFTKILDAVCMNKYLGVPVFLFMMYLMFFFSITFGAALQPMFDDLSHSVFVDGVAYYTTMFGFPHWLVALLSDGLGVGINTVLAFVPQIGILFIFLSFLEDSGYMARAAFVMDKFMQSIGLSGKAFVPLIVGFGCNVASMMAARTLETRKDRLMTIMMSPFMSCGARLAIFSVFATAFFPQSGAFVIFLLYVTGIIVAILTGYIIKFTFLKGDDAPFILDIPSYHMPHFKTVMIYSWNRLKFFLIRAGKIIVPIAIIIGTLNSIYVDKEKDVTVLGYTAQKITPVLNPMGVSDDNWPATVGLITGTLAKEVVVGTLNTIYSQDDSDGVPESYSFVDDLKGSIQDTYNNVIDLNWYSFINPVEASKGDASMDGSAMGNMAEKFGSLSAAFSYMLFVLLYIPCISVMGAMVRESTRGWAVLSIVWSTSIAYVTAMYIYQLMNFSQAPLYSSVCLIVGAMYMFILVFAMKYLSTKMRFVSNLTGCSSCTTSC